MTAPPDLRLRRIDQARRLHASLRPASSLPAPPRPPRPADVDGPAPDRGSPAARARRLAEALGGQVTDTPGGPIVVVETDERFELDVEALAALPWPLDPTRPLALLDTETTGLGTAAGTVAFLVGLGIWRGGMLRVHQLWLPDHPAEPGLLHALDSLLPSDAWLVTYNGRTFDWPLLVTRYRLHGRPPPPLAGHLDLLPVARLLWRHRLPDARLASVESGVAGLHRNEDLPGWLVPERFFSWLRGAHAVELLDVGRHNRADVVAMAHLLRVLADRYATRDGRRRVHPGDVANLARAMGRQGRLAEALECLEAALDGSDVGPTARAVDRDAVRLERARLLSKLDRHAEAVAAWQDMAAGRGLSAIHAGIALAKHLEHRCRDVPGALRAAETASEVLARRRAMGLFDAESELDLSRRLERLRRRLARQDARGVGRPSPRPAWASRVPWPPATVRTRDEGYSRRVRPGATAAGVRGPPIHSEDGA